ncbi:MAG TPA: transposase [Streptomyces sp.]|nr:transposase [Streptomyces sp.]
MQDGAPLFPGSNHWRAVCGQSRLHGSGGGRRKRTRSTGTSPAAYLTYSHHVDAAMRELIGKRPWLTVFRFPTYTPDLNPAEGVWAHLKKSLGNLAPCSIDDLAGLVRTRLKRMQYRPDLLDGFIAGTGLVTTLP